MGTTQPIPRVSLRFSAKGSRGSNAPAGIPIHLTLSGKKGKR